ncbi:MAG: hypothetical protein P8Z71_09985 [Candidatus Sulfobium sp.]
MPNIRGKSLKAVVRDVAGGYVTVNPIFLKSFDRETLRVFYGEMSRVQVEIRAEKFPTHDIAAIRNRNLRLQKLYSAMMIIKNYARERKIILT